MPQPQIIASAVLLLPLAAIISYTDVRYRRIPNKLVLVTLACGLLLNTAFGGLGGLLVSLEGCALAFGLTLLLHLFGTMGAGDVKLFAAVGSVLGVHLVLPTLVVVVLTAFVLAVYTIFSEDIKRETLLRSLQIFVSFILGKPARVSAAAGGGRRHTIPYGVAITFGSLISLFIFRA